MMLINREAIRPGFPAVVPVSQGFTKICVSVSHKIRFGIAKCLEVLEVIKITFVTMRTNILTFPQRHKKHLQWKSSHQPSSTKRRK